MFARASVAATLALEAVEAFMAILSSLFAFSTSLCKTSLLGQVHELVSWVQQVSLRKQPVALVM